MTIAACHISPEGVVLGADSATTITSANQDNICHLDYAQKVFEVGPSGSSVGLVTWGQGQIGLDSHRTIAAAIGFRHAREKFETMEAMATALSRTLWERFTQAYPDDIARARELAAKIKDGEPSEDDNRELTGLLNRRSGGYCLAGRIGDHGACEAWQVLWSPAEEVPKTEKLPSETPLFWGVPQIMQRLVFGMDAAFLDRLLKSGKWAGTPDELLDLVVDNQLISPRLLPIREAIDWVHTVIHTTIRGTKFANWPHWCGGPVEIAVITTDRPFRWVRHKPMDAAIITAEEAR